ncbi:GTPase HflX [Terrilactibacillus laevilacticus]|uniref:GTPase HflX n=1 Tax=Terrilactibacillus laevilacticus TaxID=1380157 RepID=A0ABW5PPK7_9BACI|nr:GTPase HflX [Terrilactibacillus laevilacticus]
MEKVILVGCQLPHHSDQAFDSSMQELAELTDTAGGEVISTVVQKRQKIDVGTYIGKGKLDELEALDKALEPSTIIFNSELTPGQLGRLNEKLEAKVIDRTQLILDIFAMRAFSREGKLQVELAQLQYLLPKLSGIGTTLSRLGGGIGTRGPGETKLETDRRYIRKRISDIKKQLETVVHHRERYRERRHQNDQFQIALVGYTNAGKSTIFNQLTEERTYEENRLFATLDPLTRRLICPNGFISLVSDTVGFIQDLPTTLVAAFRSTLEEASQADLILHVIDVSSTDMLQHEKTVNGLLEELGAGHIPSLKVFNKKDQLTTSFITPKDAILISAKSGQDILRLKERIQEQIIDQMTPYRMKVASTQGHLIDQLKDKTIIMSQTWIESEEQFEFTGYIHPNHPLAGKILPPMQTE